MTFEDTRHCSRTVESAILTLADQLRLNDSWN